MRRTGSREALAARSVATWFETRASKSALLTMRV
jgi:hypothetical protein